jgi:putative hydrolase of the HAD superfamily
MIRAVIFDFGGVLCLHPDQARITRAAEACGLPIEQFLKDFWRTRRDYDAGRMEPAEYWSGIVPAFQESKLPELIRNEVELWNRYDQRVFDWIGRLRKAGHRTAILSNLPRVLGEELRSTPGFLDPFDHVTFSYQLGFIKPEAEIYKDAIRGLGVKAEEAVFLDDRPENVEGGRAVGLCAELYSCWEEFAQSKLPERYGLPAAGLAEDIARRQ